MSDESVRAQMGDERFEDLPPGIRQQIDVDIDDGISFGLSPRSVRGRRHITSIRWNPGRPNRLAEVIMYRVEEDEMPLYLGGQKFMIRQVTDGETETRSG